MARWGSNSGNDQHVCPVRPWAPGWWPVTMLATLARVTVGKTAWWLLAVTRHRRRNGGQVGHQAPV